MSRAVVFEKFGGPEVLELRDVPEPHAGSGEVRVHVKTSGLNPIDVGVMSRPEAAEMFGVSVPSGFGSDFAGVIDEVGEGVTNFAIGDRVYGGALGRAIADFIIVKPGKSLWHTPDGISDEIACTLPVASLTAAAAIAAIDIHSGDTVLIGGASGGVGVFAIQLAKLAGANVIGTASKGTFEFLSQFGVKPVEYGDGLVERVKVVAPGGITAAVDLNGIETAKAALSLGISPERISTIAAGPNPEGGVRATGSADASPTAMSEITSAILDGKITVPIEATFGIEQIREAVSLQATHHAHGKIVIKL